MTQNQQPPPAASVLAADHSEVGDLILELLAAIDEGNRAQCFQHLDLLWARLAVHIRAEHLALFPSILDAPKSTFTGRGSVPQFEEAQNAINLLRDDHDFFMHELATAVNAMRESEDVSDPDVTSRLLQELRRTIIRVKTRLNTHNQLEENQVYQWVDVMLGDSERAALTFRMQSELENMPPRFSRVT